MNPTRPSRRRSRISGRQSSGRTRSSKTHSIPLDDFAQQGIQGGLSEQDLCDTAAIVQRELSSASQCHRIDHSTRRLLNLFRHDASFDLSGVALHLSFRRGALAEHMSGRSYPVRFDMTCRRAEDGKTTYNISGLKLDTTGSSAINKDLGKELIYSTESDTDVDFDLQLWPEVRAGWNEFPGAAEAFTDFLLTGGDAKTIRLKLGRVNTEITAGHRDRTTVEQAFTRLSRNGRHRVLDADEDGGGFISVQTTVLGLAEVSLCFGRPPHDSAFSTGSKTISLRLQLRPVREVTARSTSSYLFRRALRTVQKLLSL